MDYFVGNPRHFSAFDAAVSICSQYLGRLVNISVHFLAHLLPIHERNDMPTRLACFIFLFCCWPLLRYAYERGTILCMDVFAVCAATTLAPVGCVSP